MWKTTNESSTCNHKGEDRCEYKPMAGSVFTNKRCYKIIIVSLVFGCLALIVSLLGVGLYACNNKTSTSALEDDTTTLEEITGKGNVLQFIRELVKGRI